MLQYMFLHVANKTSCLVSPARKIVTNFRFLHNHWYWQVTWHWLKSPIKHTTIHNKQHARTKAKTKNTECVNVHNLSTVKQATVLTEWLSTKTHNTWCFLPKMPRLLNRKVSQCKDKLARSNVENVKLSQCHDYFISLVKRKPGIKSIIDQPKRQNATYWVRKSSTWGPKSRLHNVGKLHACRNVPNICSQ